MEIVVLVVCLRIYGAFFDRFEGGKLIVKYSRLILELD